MAPLNRDKWLPPLVNSSFDTTDRIAIDNALSDPPGLSRRADQVDAPTALSTWITQLASQSDSHIVFAERLAAGLCDRFAVALAAIIRGDGAAPITSYLTPATSASLEGRLDDGMIAKLLARATQSATACDLALRPRPGLEDTNPTARGMHIQVNHASGRWALLLVYPNQSLPDPGTQIRDLHRLSEIADCCDKALDQIASNELGEITNRFGSTSPWRPFHLDLDVDKTAYRIANETCRALAVDRVTVLIEDRGRMRVRSVSGVAVVDQRSNAVTAAQRLVERAIVLDRVLTLPTVDPLPPQITQPLDHYLDQSDVAQVILIPLYPPSLTPNSDTLANTKQPLGAMLLESFSNSCQTAMTAAMHEVGIEAGIALANAREHQRVFGLRFLKWIGDWCGGRRLPYSVTAAIATTALLVSGALIQVDHQIIATGFAEPRSQQHLFARTDGIVKEIFASDGQAVSRGQLLIQLENADLESNAETLSGEIQTTSRRLASIRALLLDPSTDVKQSSRLAIEQRQLQSELTSFNSQLELVRQQISELQITAPIDGKVSGWQLQRKLSNRPVTRGNHLLSVVDDQGPWQLRLEIADKDIAEILRAREQVQDLPIQFAAASHPDHTFNAVLKSIATAARRTPDGKTVIDAEAGITATQTIGDVIPLKSFAGDEAHSGVDVTAKIYCGRRSFLASWCSDVSDFVNRNLLFYLR